MTAAAAATTTTTTAAAAATTLLEIHRSYPQLVLDLGLTPSSFWAHTIAGGDPHGDRRWISKVGGWVAEEQERMLIENHHSRSNIEQQWRLRRRRRGSWSSADGSGDDDQSGGSASDGDATNGSLSPEARRSAAAERLHPLQACDGASGSLRGAAADSSSRSNRVLAVPDSPPSNGPFLLQLLAEASPSRALMPPPLQLPPPQKEEDEVEDGD